MSVAPSIHSAVRRPVAVLESVLDEATRTAVLDAAAESIKEKVGPLRGSKLNRVHNRSGGGFVVETAAIYAAGPERLYFIEIAAGEFADRAAEISRRYEKQTQRLGAATASMHAIYQDQQNGLFVRRSGADEAIDGLIALGNPQHLWNQLPEERSIFAGVEPITLLSHRLNRRAVLDIRAQNGTELIAKLYKKGSSKPQHSLAVNALLGRTSFGSGSPIRVPHGVSLLRSWPGYVMDKAPGVPLAGLGAERNQTGMAMAGGALGRLHRLPLRLQQAHSLVEELALLRSWVELVADIYPARARNLWVAFGRVSDALLSSSEFSLTLVHRDFHGGQVLVSGSHATLIDFDTVCNGEPSQDIGNFLGHLDLAEIECRQPMNSAGSAFLAGYGEAFRPPDATRVEAHRAATQLRLACIYAFSDRHRGLWPKLLDLALGGRP